MTPEAFYEMRLKHFFLKINEYNREKEQAIRFKAEQTRLQTATLVNIQLKKEDRIKPRELWSLPWDTETEPEEKLDAEQVKELYNGIDKSPL